MGKVLVLSDFQRSQSLCALAVSPPWLIKSLLVGFVQIRQRVTGVSEIITFPQLLQNSAAGCRRNTKPSITCSAQLPGEEQGILPSSILPPKHSWSCAWKQARAPSTIPATGWAWTMQRDWESCTHPHAQESVFPKNFF